MEKSQIIVVGTVLAALALFGLKIWSDRTATDDLLSRTAGVGSDAVELGRIAGGGGSREAFDDHAGSGGSSSARPGSAGRYTSLPGRDGEPPSHAAAGGLARSEKRVLYGAAGSRGGGQLGESGSKARAGSGAVSSVALADLPERPGLEKRSQDIVEFLSSQEPTRPEPLGEEVNPPEEDVVLEVSTADDSDKAVDVHNVEQPTDGVGVELGEDSVLAFPNAGNANGDAGTISFDVDPQWVGRDQTDNSFVQIRTPHGWDNRMQLVKNGRYLRFIFTDNSSREADISVPIDHWEPGQPHSITATWGEGQTRLYIDGQRVGQNTYTGQFQIPPSTPMYVGSDVPGGTYAGAAATLQNFKVYGRALNDEEVAFR